MDEAALADNVHALWGSAEEAFALIIDDRTQIQTKDICKVSIRRYNGPNETIAVGCDSDAEFTIDQNRDEFTYPGPDNPFISNNNDMAVYYSQNRWKWIPFDLEGLRISVDSSKPSLLTAYASDTDVVAATNGSIYRRYCDE